MRIGSGYRGLHARTFRLRQHYADPMSRRWCSLIAVSILVVACSSGDAEPDGSTTTVVATTTVADPVDPAEPVDPFDTDKFPTPTIFWEGCGENLECGFVDVPLDYSDPSSAETSLYIVRHSATNEGKRIGALLVNPGGPGFGGAYLAESATRVYDDALVQAFDIVGWDPRGTGKSIPAIDCVDDYDEFFSGGDLSPDSEDERQASLDQQKEFTELCFEKSGTILPYSGTNNSARDMEMIRRALGEQTISYFGFSYGSELGAIWASLYPETVRAAVFDGAGDPNATSREMATLQRAGFERSINAFLADCSERRNCSFHNDGDAEAAFDRLMIRLENQPIPTYPDRPELTRAMALSAVLEAMYSDQYWDVLAQALADADQGDGRGLLDLFDQYFRREPDGTYGNGIEAFLNITCADDPVRNTPEQADAEAVSLSKIAPRSSPGTIGDYTCVFWPEALDPKMDVSAPTLVPILVVGTTGDPATPLEGSRSMAQTLGNALLLVVNAEQHLGYGANGCATQVISDYLRKLELPENEAVC